MARFDAWYNNRTYEGGDKEGDQQQSIFISSSMVDV